MQLKGNAVSVDAGNLLQSAASQLNAKTTVSLKGDNGVALTAVNDSYDRHEEHSSKNGIVKGSVIETHQRSTAQGNTLTGSDITITSGSDLQLQAGKLKGDNVTLTSAGTTYLDAGLNSQYDQIDKNKTGLATVKMQGSGTTRQTASLTQIDSQNVTLNADGGVVVALPQQSGETLNQSIDRLASQPDMAWLKQVQQRKDIDWQPVQEAYDHWDYSQQSLSPAAAAVISIAVAVATGGSGVGVMAAMGDAAMSTLASQAAIALINNQGDLGATLRTMGSSANLRALATSVATAGALAGVDKGLGIGSAAKGATAQTSLKCVASWQTVEKVMAHSAVSAGVDSAINGSNFSDVFRNSLRANVGAEVGALTANTVGDYSDALGGNGSLEKSLVHGVTQAGVAEISGGDAQAGFSAGFTTELTSPLFGGWDAEHRIDAGKLTGAITGALVSNTAEGVNTGATTGETLITYNHLTHEEVDELAKDLSACRNQPDADDCRHQVAQNYKSLNDYNQSHIYGCLAFGEAACTAQLNDLNSATDSLESLMHQENWSDAEKDIITYHFDANVDDHFGAQAVEMQAGLRELAPMVLGSVGPLTGTRVAAEEAGIVAVNSADDVIGSTALQYSRSESTDLIYGQNWWAETAPLKGVGTETESALTGYNWRASGTEGSFNTNWNWSGSSTNPLGENVAANTIERAFKLGEDVIHFGKHGTQIAQTLGYESYSLGQYVQDANAVIRNGTFFLSGMRMSQFLEEPVQPRD